MPKYESLFSKQLADEKAEQEKDAERKERIRKQYAMSMMLWTELSISKLRQEEEEEQERLRQEDASAPSTSHQKDAAPLSLDESIINLRVSDSPVIKWRPSVATAAELNRQIPTHPMEAKKLFKRSTAKKNKTVKVLYSKKDKIFNVSQFNSDSEEEIIVPSNLPKKRKGPGHCHYTFVHKD